MFDVAEMLPNDHVSVSVKRNVLSCFQMFRQNSFFCLSCRSSVAAEAAPTLPRVVFFFLQRSTAGFLITPELFCVVKQQR